MRLAFISEVYCVCLDRDEGTIFALDFSRYIQKLASCLKEGLIQVRLRTGGMGVAYVRADPLIIVLTRHSTSRRIRLNNDAFQVADDQSICSGFKDAAVLLLDRK